MTLVFASTVKSYEELLKVVNDVIANKDNRTNAMYNSIVVFQEWLSTLVDDYEDSDDTGCSEETEYYRRLESRSRKQITEVLADEDDPHECVAIGAYIWVFNRTALWRMNNNDDMCPIVELWRPEFNMYKVLQALGDYCKYFKPVYEICRNVRLYLERGIHGVNLKSIENAQGSAVDITEWSFPHNVTLLISSKGAALFIEHDIHLDREFPGIMLR